MNAHGQAERQYIFLPQESCDECELDCNVRVNKVFPPQSFSSGHTKGLPIGIILSFVLLTSMKLPSLVFFFCLFCFAFCFVLFFFSNFFFMLQVVTIFGGVAYLVKDLKSSTENASSLS